MSMASGKRVLKKQYIHLTINDATLMVNSGVPQTLGRVLLVRWWNHHHLICPTANLDSNSTSWSIKSSTNYIIFTWMVKNVWSTGVIFSIGVILLQCHRAIKTIAKPIPFPFHAFLSGRIQTWSSIYMPHLKHTSVPFNSIMQKNFIRPGYAVREHSDTRIKYNKQSGEEK
jgi:hypothetical protein